VSDKGILEAFLDGLRKGWQLGTYSLLPNVLMAFVIIEILKLTGILEVIGTIFGPVMSSFGLPGEAVTVLLSSWMSGLGGAGVAASLYAEGLLSGRELTILAPGIFLMGAQIQYMGRVLGVAGVNPRHYKILFLISIINATLAMLTMRFIIL
jgi:spore maturation protein SpmB